METLVQIAGWIGTFLILLAYFLISYKKVSGDSTTYQLMNLFGVIGVGINVFYQRAWPAVVLQLIWGIIAISALLRKKV